MNSKSSVSEIKDAMNGKSVYDSMRKKIIDYIKENKDIIKQYDKIIKYEKSDTKSFGTTREMAKEETETIIKYYFSYMKKLHEFVLEINTIVKYNLSKNITKYNMDLINLIDVIQKNIDEINKRIKHINKESKKSLFSKCLSCMSKQKSLGGGKKKKRKYKKMI